MRESILGLNRHELRERLSELGLKPYRADQILGWIYKKGVRDFESMTDVSKEDRLRVRDAFAPREIELVEAVPSADSSKYIFRTYDDHLIETVLIRERDHLTLCVSTQIGCAVGCRFCATALDGLVRNLSAGEIIDQFLSVREHTGEKIRNVVFMGMGEPLANYPNLRKAVEIMVSDWGLDLSKRRITVSTSGVIPQIKKMAQDELLREVNLAVSINSPFEEERKSLMPRTGSGTLQELINTLGDFPLRKYRKITLEYVMIGGVNDSQKHALAFATLIKGKRRFKVNLIPFNPDPELPFERPSLEKVIAFQRTLWERGISTFVRFSKGAETFGACGQLRTKRYAMITHP